MLDPDVLRWSLQALLCGRADEWRRFDELFDAWFLPANRWQQPRAARAPTAACRAAMQPRRLAASATPPTTRDEPRPRHAASRQEVLSSTDFRALTEREHALDIEALMRRFARQLRHIRLRREARARHGRRLDLPATIRRSVASGGTPFHLAWRDRRRVRPRLVLLIDVSRSMALYSFFYLRLARALSAELTDVHSFIFHTRITAVSRGAARPRPVARAGATAPDRAGLGRRHAHRREPGAVQPRARAAPACIRAPPSSIMSDGYDTGDPQRVVRCAGRSCRRRARRIVWLNPLCNRPGYAPVCQGMQAALPHLDLLAPGGGPERASARCCPS